MEVTAAPGSSGMSSETIRPEERPPCRRFGVTDAMAFIAGLALILAAGGAQFAVALAEQFVGLARTIWNYDSPSFRTLPRSWRDQLWIQWSTVLWSGFRVIQ